MASFNKVILMGNLTRDPDLKVTGSGLSICKLGLAVSRKFKKADGTESEDTAFVDVDAFGKQAEVLSKYLSKGSPLMLEGRLKFDTWESNGEKRNKLGVVLETFQFIGGGQQGGGNRGGGNSYDEVSPPARNSAPKQQESSDFDMDEDVPF